MGCRGGRAQTMGEPVPRAWWQRADNRLGLTHVDRGEAQPGRHDAEFFEQGVMGVRRGVGLQMHRTREQN